MFVTYSLWHGKGCKARWGWWKGQVFFWKANITPVNSCREACMCFFFKIEECSGGKTRPLTTATMGTTYFTIQNVSRTCHNSVGHMLHDVFVSKFLCVERNFDVREPTTSKLPVPVTNKEQTGAGREIR